MWPYIKATNTNCERTETGCVKWHRIDKENTDYFIFENNNSRIKCLKNGTIRITIDLYLTVGSYVAQIFINGCSKKQKVKYTQNWDTLSMNEIFEINSNDYIDININGTIYNHANENNRLQIEMLSVNIDIN